VHFEGLLVFFPPGRKNHPAGVIRVGWRKREGLLVMKLRLPEYHNQLAFTLYETQFFPGRRKIPL